MTKIDEALADVRHEGSDPFVDLEKETPTESLPVEEPKEEVKVEEPVVEKTKEEGGNTPEDNIPFHKHPRWIEREEELKALRERDEVYEREIAELKALSIKNEPVNVPEWFKELYGENETAYQKYLEHEQVRTEEIKKKVIEEQEQKVKQQQDETEKWNKWVSSEYDKLESEGYKFDRDKFAKVMLDYMPTDEQNNLDFKKGYKIYEALEPKPNPAISEARKQLADTVTGGQQGEKKSKDYMTPSDLRNKSWGNIA